MATKVESNVMVETNVPLSDDEKGSPSSASPTLHEENDNKEEVSPVPKDEEDDDSEFLIGWKLVSLMISITLAAFLMLLDMSIIVTVCSPFVQKDRG